MSASINDKFRKGSNGDRPVVTSLSLPLLDGDTTATLSVATGWTTDTGVDVTIFRKDISGNIVAGSQTDWVAVLSGVTLSSMTLRAGTMPSGGYPADELTIVKCGPTAAWADDFSDGILAEHSQSGTHDATKVAMLAGAQTFTGNKTFSGTVTLPDGTATPPKWTNPYGFRVYFSSAFFITNTWTIATFTDKSYDLSSNYSTSTGLFTAPVAGTYRFYAKYEASSTNLAIRLYKNGSTVISTNFSSNVGSAINQSVHIYDEVQLAANDTIAVWMESSSTPTTGSSGSDRAFFTGSLIQAS